MPGQPGNPNHDPRTGKFTSGSGHNVTNSTVGERVKGRFSTAKKVAIAGGLALAGVAIDHLVKAAISGVSAPIKAAAERRTVAVMNKYGPKIEKAAAKGAKTAIGAIKAAHGAQAGNRVAALQAHIAAQHKTTRSRKVTMDVPGKFSRGKGFS